MLTLLFYFIWLPEIAPEIFQNIMPKTVVEAGLFINVLHGIDLSVILAALCCLIFFLWTEADTCAQ